jgi:hypothetical protein
LSDPGTILDEIVTLATGAVSGLSVTRGGDLSEHLESADFPHLFLHSPEASVEVLDWRQEETTYSFEGELVTDATTEEALLLDVEAIRDAIRGDPTLSGGCAIAWLSGWVAREDPRAHRRFAELTISARRVD